MIETSLPLPDVVLADPPWQYSKRTTPPDKTIEFQYDTCTTEDLCGHRPETTKAAVLFLWAVAPLIPEALQVMEAWGFKYKTGAIWDKQVFGLGHWFRSQHEHILVGVKGKVKTIQPRNLLVPSIFKAQRTKHSVKPECVQDWIDRAFPNSVKMEMYGRRLRPGWQVWQGTIDFQTLHNWADWTGEKPLVTQLCGV